MAVISAETSATCDCGFAGRLTFRESEGWVRECPSCGKALHSDHSRVKVKKAGFLINREFHGERRKSLTKGCHPTEVGFLRQNMPKSGHCINETGDVSFVDRAEERTYDREFGEMAERLGGMPDPKSGGSVEEVVEG